MKTPIKVGDSVHFKKSRVQSFGNGTFKIAKIFKATKKVKVSLGIRAFINRKKEDVELVRFENQPSYLTSYPIQFLTK